MSKKTIIFMLGTISMSLLGWKYGKEIPWVKVFQLPIFTSFSHQVHVDSAKIDCDKCHADIKNKPITYPKRMSMNECKSCHKKMGVSNGCLYCHLNFDK